MANDRSEGPAAAGAPRPAATQQPVRWDDSNIKSSYANVCNVSSTREEVVLVFGTNQAWERGKPEVRVELSHRIIFSPFAAKRLAELLNNVMREYEGRFGSLSVGDSRPGEPPEARPPR
jgi:hypothetical protein